MAKILSAILFINIIFYSCQKEIGSKRNSPPVANAGPDQTIILPTNTVVLDGSSSTDPNNNISNYLWTKVAGQLSFNIANAEAVQTQVTNLVQGIYLFELKVTDAGGFFDKDTIQVTVMKNPPASYTNSKIVFVSDRDGNNEIYSCNADGSNVIRLTNDGALDRNPAWSPDGTRIAFVRSSDINSDIYGLGDLYIMNADGSNVVQRTFTGDVNNPAWSPDGTRIAFNNSSFNSIFLIDLASGAVSPLPNAEGSSSVPDPDWSPDGTKIAFESDRLFWDFRSDIFNISPNGSGLTYILYGQDDYWRPCWSPDGTKLSVTINNVISGTTGGTTDGSIGVINANGTGLRIITSGLPIESFIGTRTSWSPDGTRIAYTENKTIKWVSVDGSATGTIIGNGWDADWQH